MGKNTPKTILTILLILCLYTTTTLKNVKTLVNASPSTLSVPYDFESIQEAINNASPGDIIHVCSGIYQENIIINKSITLMGENRENTIIDGGKRGNVITIQASNINISGFTIQNSDPTGCGIYIERFGNIVISNNNIKNNYIGIQITFSSQNQICGNTISANYIGIQLIYSSGNTICRNDIKKSNIDGIEIFYSTSNMIYENIFSSNGYWGVYISWNSEKNVFYHNNFINNGRNVYTEQANNIWSIDGEGNYWDVYSGEDLNKDGIGDIPYNVTEGNIDYYPLMGMFYRFIASFNGNLHHIAIISNSTILNFTFKTIAETQARVILLNASGNSGSASFSRIAIPKALMPRIHTVLINEEEVNATLLNVGNMENIYLYIEYSGDCSIKIVYSELLDWYYQLLYNYTELLNKYEDLNESYSMLLDWHYQLLYNYTELLDKYRSLNESYSMLLELNVRFSELNASANVLIEKLDALNMTLYNLLRNYSKLLDEFNDMTSLYKSQTQNFKGLIYIFAATTTIFTLTTIYFSKKAHEKVVKSKVNE
ncbi:MAG: NosD domain-containing protein [Candidatus Bathyarchaeia archaeon]